MTTAPALRPARGLPIVRDVTALREWVAVWRAEGARVGMVPTMGALHRGHSALIARARAQCGRVVATLFVNPKQFNRKDDLDRYPRDEAQDAAFLEAAGVDLLFAPATEEMYPAGFATTVSVSGLTECLCGVVRPGHLTGVATVVTKLLLQGLPDSAYFGEKDYQQLLVVRRLIRDLDIPVDIVGVPTVREDDGLALSSRNVALNAAERAVAPALCRVLREAAARLAAGTAAEPVLREGSAALTTAGFESVDYFDLRDGETLAALERANPTARVFAAAWLGRTRLIDNLAVYPAA